MVSRHYKKKRYKRERIIKNCLNGDGKVIDSFIVDRGHVKGKERHDITNTGVVLVYNVSTQKLVTKLIPREGQLRKYYENAGEDPPSYLIDLANWHTGLLYNYVK